jgi:hypothetical protein
MKSEFRKVKTEMSVCFGNFHSSYFTFHFLLRGLGYGG